MVHGVPVATERDGYAARAIRRGRYALAVWDAPIFNSMLNRYRSDAPAPRVRLIAMLALMATTIGQMTVAASVY